MRSQHYSVLAALAIGLNCGFVWAATDSVWFLAVASFWLSLLFVGAVTVEQYLFRAGAEDPAKPSKETERSDLPS